MLASPGISSFEAALITFTVAVAAFLLFGLYKAIQSHRRRPAVGKEALIGQRAVAVTDLDPEGQVELRGEIWRAVSRDGKIEKDAPVQVVEERNLTLYVKRT